MAQGPKIMGGWSHPPKEADLGISEICNQVRIEVQDRINGGNQFGEFVAKLYIQAVVAGMLYRVKVQINDVSLIRIEVFQPPLLDGVQGPPQLKQVVCDGPLNDQPW
ncbi:uncharacterized protein LOC135822773 [Sycon ciliatum]|uniref:uncharacterized protein LOC135822773 n=1 Tax=Sycon ciliatum TaxID=27933 RepID=UPI0020AC83DB|eukprot:scpid83811/ scgid24003/ 